MQRYLRQIRLPEIGVQGQARLKAAKVLCVGVGGLGSPVLLYLAAAGIGTLGMIDGDSVDVSNLQRQVLFNTDDVGTLKVSAAENHLRALNPDTHLITHLGKLTAQTALEIIEPYDLIVDGTDNFTAKYLINDACFHLKKPWIYAGILAFEGQCSVFSFENSPCYRCIYPENPTHFIPNCAETGVIGTLPGLLGSIQANEALKMILNIGHPLIGKLLKVDVLNLDFKKYHLQHNTECILCQHKTLFADLYPPTLQPISIDAFQEMMRLNTAIQFIDVRESYEHAEHNIGGINIPLTQLPSALHAFNKNLPVVLYCQAGLRSQEAGKIFQREGFTQVFYLLRNGSIFSE